VKVGFANILFLTLFPVKKYKKIYIYPKVSFEMCVLKYVKNFG
jgi:hypothetical protein